MKSRPRIFGSATALCSFAALLLLPSVGSATVAPANTCFWGQPAAITNGSYPAGTNIDFPDTHAAYWYSSFSIAPGDQIVLHGTYPYARYFSFSLYGTVAGQPGSPLAALHDTSIVPDPGSSNPFMPGAFRWSAHRSYTVTVSGDPDPGAGLEQPNTLYAGTPGATGPQEVQLLLRVYVPNLGVDWSGGGLPTWEFDQADGTTSTGTIACAALGTGATQPDLAIPVAEYDQLLSFNPLTTAPAVDPPVWYAFFNVEYAEVPFLVGTPEAGLIATLPTAKTGGLYSNADSAYVYQYVDRTFGPDPNGDNILVLQGEMPTTPATRAWEPIMNGNVDMRYWSLCNNQSIATTAVTDCLDDEQVPVNSAHDYTIVLSLPQDRPTNAYRRCGVAWMNWGTAGDGLDRPRTDLLIMRNLLPNPAFTQAIQDIQTPGTEQAVMGPYLPTDTYETAAQFEATGCNGVHSS
jgi:hypothetical protein